ncbi:ABC-type multidrug transport system fused ATPase/permease subunit [Streptosporangium becharense]|uniref:ABC-type multidrug transport system fused ATPase/permease subunit n=1 Tax=Streptosporangium becharense TaxID=1816182 RepID=A0A7W9IBF1_9ACTN|nr:ABC transporter ATP-binding protein [Streptosporangium becharense]MBB2910625.1 ABC-type multidrug transport system fused ATPase/permease subunit [Streptosporangium becharense]MBB5817321.1 ABC-type multidrug transport system fused ATPase/permease subunit [Streptosporangium becharense]
MLAALLGFAWRADRRNVLVVAVLLLSGGAVVIAEVWFIRDMVDAAVAGRWTRCVTAAVAAGLLAASAASIGRVQSNLELQLGERIGLEVDRQVLTAVSGVPHIGHVENPDYLDRVALIRARKSWLTSALWNVGGVANTAVVLTLGIALMLTVHPLSALMVPAGVPVLLLRAAGQRKATALLDRATPLTRLEQHLTGLCLSPDANSEIRIGAAGDGLDERADRLWSQASAIEARADLRTARFAIAGSAILVASYTGALAVVAWLISQGRAGLGDLMMVVILTATLTRSTTSLAGSVTALQRAVGLLDRYHWLRDFDAGLTPASGGAAPATLRSGITLSGVCFRYPGSEADVLRDIDLTIPAGTSVAVVGPHGAGKSTLIKLLCGLYEPTTGVITVDDRPLTAIEPASWQSAVTAAFQDGHRFELRLAEAVGIGDLPHMHDESRVEAAIRAAGAEDVVAATPHGLRTPLGRSLDGGVDLSGGQWQKLALARAAMRTRPLLVVLDEPFASLDAPAERDLVRRYAETAGQVSETGAITVFVTHRLSTARIADLIVVVEDGGITEVGKHEDLAARRGLYAELHRMQVDSYA